MHSSGATRSSPTARRKIAGSGFSIRTVAELITTRKSESSPSRASSGESRGLQLETTPIGTPAPLSRLSVGRTSSNTVKLTGSSKAANRSRAIASSSPW